MVKMQILVASLNKGFSFIEIIVTLLIISLVGSSFYIFFQNSNIPVSLNAEIKNFQDFQKNYQDSDMHLDYVIRNRLHTAIYINQEKNYLESMDGSMFNLTQNINASKLTDEVVKLIGGMYYGSSEVRELENN